MRWSLSGIILYLIELFNVSQLKPETYKESVVIFYVRAVPYIGAKMPTCLQVGLEKATLCLVVV